MSNIWNKDTRIMEMLSKQYNLELRASNLYYNSATLAKALGYDYVSEFFVGLAKDKQTSHLQRILEYFLKLDTEMPIMTISVPERIKGETIQEIVNEALILEKGIRKHIADTCELALKLNDFETFEMLQWFVKDAIKDLSDVQDLWTYVTVPNATLLSIETAVHRKNKKEDKEGY